MPTQNSLIRFAICIAVLLVVPRAETAENWPMWRADAHRSAATDNSVSTEVALLWKRSFSRRKQAWDDPLNLDLMTYDKLLEPIVIDGMVIVGFNDQDKVIGLNAVTGDTQWTFYTEAPVRMPPAGANGKVYLTCDDGNLYCLDVNTGKLVWKFRGAPSAQHAIGNQRLTSAWPARGGVVLADDQVYFAASIWPFMGTFLYALDAETGEVQWVNDHTGAQYIKQPHSAPSFAGVAPQGAMVATKNLLVVPGGRSVPAVFDRLTGELKYFELNAGGKGTGGSFVAANEEHFFVHTRLKGTRAFRLVDGVKSSFMPNEPVLHHDRVYSAESTDDGPVIKAYGQNHQLLWSIAADGLGDLIKAGNHLIAAGESTIEFIRLGGQGNPAVIVRTIETPKRYGRLLVADEKLFAVSMDGDLVAYGATNQLVQSTNNGKTKPNELQESEQATVPVESIDKQIAQEILSVGAQEGYAFWFGPCDDKRAIAIASQSPFVQLAMVDPTADAIDRVRQTMDAAGIHGRVTVHHASPSEFKPPSHVAHQVFVANADSIQRQDLVAAYAAVRPYGGTMYLLTEKKSVVSQEVHEAKLEQAEVSTGEHGVIVRRVGALPGAADWTHQYGNIANTVKSDDSRVKLPLGILWFGGSSNMDVLPRHGHGPPEQVVGGRLFIQGMNSLSARDVYTGRVLWKRQFKDLGTFDVYYDSTYEDTPLNPKYNQVHIPGANARGTNFVVTDDRVYVVESDCCHAIDPATGKSLATFQLPADENGEREQWGYIGVYKDVLIGGRGFAMYRGRNRLSFEGDAKLKKNKKGFGSKSYDRAASVGLIGFDRHTGEQLWSVDARHSFWHNGIVAGGGRIYCLDRTPRTIEEALMRRGKSNRDSYRILAFDFQTGQTQWEISENIFGTWLGYSEQHDLLLQAGAKGSDRLYDEVASGMAVYRGHDGSEKWSHDSLEYSGPCILHNDLIITNANSYAESAGAFYLETGKPKWVVNPLTGQKQPWKIKRAYGCNNIIASENLLTFRSGAAGFYDLLTDGGTGNLGGFKSGCTSNLIAADGVLNAPDYTRTCSCAYQNQTSLALVHMPEIETWTVHNVASTTPRGQVINSLAINFGAPGDRRDQEGTLWMEYPPIAGDSPPLSIEVNPGVDYFKRHSTAVPSAARPWIAASGATGIQRLRLQMILIDDGKDVAETGSMAAGRFDVELVFASPGDGKTRVFDIQLAGLASKKRVSLGSNHQVEQVVHFRDVEIHEELEVQLIPVRGSPVLSGIHVTRL